MADVIFEGVDYLASEDINKFLSGKHNSPLIDKKMPVNRGFQRDILR
jgi:hypothetical protein